MRSGLLCAAAGLWAAACLAEQGESLPEAGDWPLEEVRTADERVYRGLVYAERDGELEFVEVVRPRGRPMHLVVRPIPARSIVSVSRLPEEERNKLADRVYAFRYRTRIEAGRMESVELAERDDGRRKFLRYRGQWFTLDSTADDETTRRCVVRIEQIFRAYRQLLPPRAVPQRQLRVLLLDSMDQYTAFLRENELEEVSNPALYSLRGNVIVAASELGRYAQRLQVTRDQHEEIRRQYEELDRALPRKLAELGRRLRGHGVAEDDIKAERNARLALWQSEMQQVLQQLAAADRRNEARFAEVTDEMFSRLYHEGLHAYLENYVYPHRQYDVPVWLHEGLAQVFQSGRLEADTLRIDAPLSEALAEAQRDLQSADPLLIEELVSAGQRDFLGGSAERTARLYAHAWAMAYYLTFYQPVLGTDALHEYVSADAALLPPPARLERLLGTSIADFEPRWRKTILELKPP